MNRTTINYQYRYNLPTSQALAQLYKEGGITRFYQGLPFALLQGPLSRFGDTAANSLALALMQSLSPDMSILGSTGVGSILAGTWRIFLTPIETFKTCLQVEGKEGLQNVQLQIQKKGVLVLYNGALAASLATIIGHYPWYATFNYLSVHFPTAQELQDYLQVTYNFDGNIKALDICRSAVIGMIATSLSDLTSNSFRVLKTFKQSLSSSSTNNETSEMNVDSNYLEIIKFIIKQNGVLSLFTRGLQVSNLSFCFHTKNANSEIIFTLVLD